MTDNHFIVPDWPAPNRVHALVTTRLGGVSHAPYDTLNLASHVGDDPQSVHTNRSLLANKLGLPAAQFRWLKQVHGTLIVKADEHIDNAEADGMDTQTNELVCTVLTADCLPILLCDLGGSRVSAVHAGWRGLASGIVAAAVRRFPQPERVMAWFGPAISQPNFEVGEEVIQAFTERWADADKAFIRASQLGKWLADIYQLATLQLHQAGVHQIYGGGLCTYADPTRFYSFRRDGEQSGRMASMIWLEATPRSQSD